MKTITSKSMFSIVILCLIALSIHAAEIKYIDLSTFANHDGQTKLGKNYSKLPRNQKIISLKNNTPFIVYQGSTNNIFTLTSGNFIANMPETITIPVNDYAGKIHFFGQMHFEVPNNRIIGKYTINFEEGTSIDILLDTDPSSPQWNADDHCCNWRAKDLTKANLAWEDSSQAEKRALIREYVWNNPAPTKKIASIDFSSFKTTANPVLAAITYVTPDNGAVSDACELPTINSNLDIQIPSANYQTLLGTTKLWANFEFVGKDSKDQFLWRLKDFGQRQ